MSDRITPASFVDALIPVIFLAVALFTSVNFYGEDSSYGPNQIALIFSACVALLIGLKNGHSWRELEGGIYEGMSVVFAPSFILLAVGMMIATWIVGGVVPSMIYYGLQLMNPSIFYAASCVVCAIISLSIGSSWTTAASVGVALIGTAIGLGLSVEITAGAIISGAYFGDKMSPLSDTTNLAPAVANVDLFSHIRHMVWTGVPSLAIAIILFLIIGLFAEPVVNPGELQLTLDTLSNSFTIAWYMLLPLVALLALAWKKMPALPAILIAAFIGAIYAVIFQTQNVIDLVGESEQNNVLMMLKALWTLAVSGYEANTNNVILDDLLSGGGAANMLNTIWLILCAVFFGGAMERTGLLRELIEAILSRAKSTSAMITSTILTCIGTNIITGDQYIAIVLPGRMYKAAFHNKGLAPVNLSRAIEDSATVTSPLVPWNTCGAFMAASLGVATFAYLPFCFFNLIMPVISIFYGVINFKILPLEE
ncbi:Na+/H+ antiporter NhaC [Gammaproteobacteria bacterium]|nr:Na+/H+ antiporter NhaC [Gammaproteobacteria bacterium]